MGGNIDQGRGSIEHAAGERADGDHVVSPFLGRVTVWAASLIAAGMLASCAPMPSSQVPVQTSSPSVSYKFLNDQELLTAHQNAVAYCLQYQGAPRMATITENPDGGKVVKFDCVPTSSPLPPPVTPNLSYSYRTEQELVQASQTAGAYCQRYGSQPMTSTITTNEHGLKTVTFQCGLR